MLLLTARQRHDRQYFEQCSGRMLVVSEDRNIYQCNFFQKARGVRCRRTTFKVVAEFRRGKQVLVTGADAQETVESRRLEGLEAT